MTVNLWFVRLAVAVCLLAAPAVSPAQERLSLQQAVDAGLATRPLLKADTERVTIAEARVKQAGVWANPELQFTNENLRPGQTYRIDVDVLAVVTQPLDILGKRGGRVDLAGETVKRTTEELELARRDVALRVKRAYWVARGAQEQRDTLRATVDNFKRIVDYHAAQLSVGTIAEQDVLRVRLEHEQLQIAAHLATIDATTARVALLNEIGRDGTGDVELSEPLDQLPVVSPSRPDVALGQRSEIRVARAVVEEARANLRLQEVLARPDLGVIFGYKRTLLPDAVNGVNTAIAGLRVTVPLFDRNQGNREAAAADMRRQDYLLADTETRLRGELERAQQEYQLRRAEVADTLVPLRDHAASLAQIARAAYQQGGVDLLRLLDAERARLDGERAWVQGMVAFQQSVVSLEFAQGAAR